MSKFCPPFSDFFRQSDRQTEGEGDKDRDRQKDRDRTERGKDRAV